jgi:type IV/VI secretion system ImpK/VasF family protein
MTSSAAVSADWQADLDLSASIAQNPLVGCASGLLGAAAQLRGTASHPNPSALLDGLAGQVRQFETCARAKGMADAVVLPARYVLCALLDESVLDTPWGSESVWGARGLLISFHNETWGGEKFFQALDRLLAHPSGNLNLLELLYLCLALGFEGRYRVRDGGRSELEQVREKLYLTIRNQRGEPEQELSPHWRGYSKRRDPLIHQPPSGSSPRSRASHCLGYLARLRLRFTVRPIPCLPAWLKLAETFRHRLPRAKPLPSSTTSSRRRQVARHH